MSTAPQPRNTERLADVDQRIADAATTTAARHPHFADAIGHSLDRLRGGLARAHARSEAVDDASWATYVDDLDRGLGELDKEIARAAEGSIPGTSVDDVLTLHATGLELQGVAPAGEPPRPGAAPHGRRDRVAEVRVGLRDRHGQAGRRPRGGHVPPAHGRVSTGVGSSGFHGRDPGPGTGKSVS